MAEQMGTEFTAVVVGAGAVGLAAAAVLARLGRVAIIEASIGPAPDESRWGVSARTVALHGESRSLLESLDVWQEIDAHPIRSMHVWEVDGTAAIDFNQATGLAWVADSFVLERALNAVAESHDVSVWRGAVVESIEARVSEEDNARWQVTFSQRDGVTDTISADLVVGADGSASTVGALFNVPRERVGRAQWAIATIAKSVEPHNDIAHQRFNRDGPVATLPLRDPHLSSVIWSADRERFDTLKERDEPAFCRALSHALEDALTIEAVDRRFAFPLNPGYARSVNPADGVALIGDAARTLHPLAGQGLNLGFEDVVALRQVVAREGTISAGTKRAWRQFADDRRARSRFMLSFLSSLLEVYRRQGPFARLVRNVGVKALEGSPRLKAQLIREAMGLGPLAKVGLP